MIWIESLPEKNAPSLFVSVQPGDVFQIQHYVDEYVDIVLVRNIDQGTQMAWVIASMPSTLPDEFEDVPEKLLQYLVFRTSSPNTVITQAQLKKKAEMLLGIPDSVDRSPTPTDPE